MQYVGSGGRRNLPASRLVIWYTGPYEQTTQEYNLPLVRKGCTCRGGRAYLDLVGFDKKVGKHTIDEY